MKLTKKWLEKQSACIEGKKWFAAQKETDGIAVVKKLMAEKQCSWANWLIVRVMAREQFVKYAVFAAEQVAYLWKDKYPDKYKIWKQWVDDGCPAAAAAAYADAAYAAYAAYAAAAYADAAYADAAYAAYAAYAAAAYADAAYAAAAYAAAAYADADKRDEMKIKILNYGLKLLEVK